MRQITLVLSAVVFSSVAFAATIRIDSVPGLPTSFSGIQTVAITAHPLWQPNNPTNPGDTSDNSAVWISYADTGYGGSNFQPYEGTTPVVTVFDTFQSDLGFLKLSVWSDDTADVLLDGNYLLTAVFTQSVCSGQPIGCRPQDAGIIDVPISAGDHTLSFVMYQVGTGGDTISNPFGLLYTGTASPIPEPGTCLIAGSAFVLFGLIGRKRSSQRKNL